MARSSRSSQGWRTRALNPLDTDAWREVYERLGRERFASVLIDCAFRTEGVATLYALELVADHLEREARRRERAAVRRQVQGSAA